MKARSVSGKRTRLVFRDNAPVIAVEFSSVAQVFMHDGGTVVDVLRAEDVGKLVDQSNNVRFGFGMRARVAE